MSLFNLHNIVNQENLQCSNDTAYNIFSQTNNGFYSIDGDLKQSCKCTMIDAQSENEKCPSGQTASTYYPLLNKLECCAPCVDEIYKIKECKLPSNHDNITNKFYPINYDLSMFHENPHFVNIQNYTQDNKQEQIIIPSEENIKQEVENFSNLDGTPNTLIIEPIESLDNIMNAPVPASCEEIVEHMGMCSGPVIKINLNYLVIFCLFVLIILGGIIICKKKNIV